MERERKINWLGLFIKIIIIFIFILIIIWLLSKITMKTRLSNTFKNNIANMETAATNYFKDVDLPLENGKSLKITLGEMIDKGLIVSANDKNGESCDTTNSLSKITRKKNNYVISTTLKCGDEKNTITKKFSIKDCKNCNDSQNNIENKENNNNSQSNNKDNDKPNIEEDASKPVNSGTLTYYEYVKETPTYSKWMKGEVTGNNIENKYEYYGIARRTYYSLGIINEKEFKVGNTITYTLKMNSVPNSKYYFTKEEDSSYYNSSEESHYINEKNITLDKNNYDVAKSITKYSLTANNFTYSLSPYYRKGEFYIDVEVTITNTNEVSSYKSGNTNIYYVPLKINIKFASDKIVSTIPSGDYETITYYRYIEVNKDIIWSADSYVDGYTKTGNSEER